MGWVFAGGSPVVTPSQTPLEGSSRDAQHPDAGWTNFEASTLLLPLLLHLCPYQQALLHPRICTPTWVAHSS